ncbi:MAG: hypothetical protein QXX95_00335 [Nitrososphaerales archaeon]
MMGNKAKASIEIKCLKAKVRVDSEDNLLEKYFGDSTYLIYRLGVLEFSKETSKPNPDIIIEDDKDSKNILLRNDTLLLKGNWSEGEVQRILVSILVKRLEENELYPLHAAALNYKSKNIIFLSGEENHGKTMCLIEASNRKGKVIGTESLICDKKGLILSGTRDVFLKKRLKGTERSDKPSTKDGVAKFFKELPNFTYYELPAKPDLIILPDIDGNFDIHVIDLNPFEREYQTFYSISSFYALSTLICSNVAMPLLDNNLLRENRAKFVKRLSSIPYFLIRAPNPQLLIDEVEKLLI